MNEFNKRKEKDDEPSLTKTDRYMVDRTAATSVPVPHILTQLRRFTPARIALERVGDSLPTSELLRFGLAHAEARDAVHTPLDTASIVRQLQTAGLSFIQIHSAAKDRATYLRHPDLGRMLDDSSRTLLSASKPSTRIDIAFVIADGLSPAAPKHYAVPIIRQFRQSFPDLTLSPIAIAEQARAALGDEIGDLLRAEITVMLIGERPGLSSPDSLGIYLTYAPKPGRTDADRNCISNIRTAGMSVERAINILSHLVLKSRHLGRSGIVLKDNSDSASLPLRAD